MAEKIDAMLLKTAVAATGRGGQQRRAQTGATKKVHYTGNKPAQTPLFSSAVSYGNLLFISGIGAHVHGDIKVHTEIVLNEIRNELEKRRLLHGQSAEGQRLSE